MMEWTATRIRCETENFTATIDQEREDKFQWEIRQLYHPNREGLTSGISPDIETAKMLCETNLKTHEVLLARKS